MPASHKDVIVGTGVLDCPLARKFDTQKAKINPDRFFCRGSFILFDKFLFIVPFYRQFRLCITALQATRASGKAHTPYSSVYNSS